MLDLTRVIAGPVAGRALASYGADVLKVGARHLPEVPLAFVDTGFGMRSCHIDLRSEAGTLRHLMRDAHIVLQAYRPGALAKRGFGPGDVPVWVDISAYGHEGPWANRRGYDSLVQMASGIADEGRRAAGVDCPVPLPCQALDHATGYLAAHGALVALRRSRQAGGAWHVQVSLARTAKWLDVMGRLEGGLDTPEPDLTEFLMRTDGLTHVMPPGRIGDAKPYWTLPPPIPGEHAPEWVH